MEFCEDYFPFDMYLFAVLEFQFNRFIPKLLIWTLPSLNNETYIVTNRVYSQNQQQNANSVHPDDTSSSGALLKRYIYWSVGIKGLNQNIKC